MTSFQPLPCFFFAIPPFSYVSRGPHGAGLVWRDLPSAHTFYIPFRLSNTFHYLFPRYLRHFT